MHNDLIIRTIFRQEECIKNLSYLSGDDLHYLAMTPFKKNYIGLTTLTSTNDRYTYKFGDIQYANQNTQEKNKAEYCRPLLYLIHIDKNIVTFDKSHTDLINYNMYNQEPIKNIFIRAIRDAYPVWKNNIIRDPISFKSERLNEIAITLCENRLEELKHYKKDLIQELQWEKKSEEDKKTLITYRNKSRENDILDRKNVNTVNYCP